MCPCATAFCICARSHSYALEYALYIYIYIYVCLWNCLLQFVHVIVPMPWGMPCKYIIMCTHIYIYKCHLNMLLLPML